MKMNRILLIGLVILVSSCNLPRGAEPISQEPLAAAQAPIQEEPSPPAPTAKLSHNPPALYRQPQPLSRHPGLFPTRMTRQVFPSIFLEIGL
ncbi:MAG: hypothetical protein WBB69_10980 [Anaerolineales bacterium]